MQVSEYPDPAQRRLPSACHNGGMTRLNPESSSSLYRVILVCTGNICRSAMAEAVLRDRLAGPLAQRVHVSSAGVSDEEHGNPMDHRARRVLAAADYTTGPAAEVIDHHRAHRITDEEILGSNLILAMTARHERELRRRAERLGADLTRIRMYRSLDPEAGPATDLDVPDPWYGTEADFEDTLAVVERVSDALATRLADETSTAAP